MSLNINWDDVIKKEARGMEDYELGEVHEIEAYLSDKDKFYLPKNLIEVYDGHKLRSRVTKEEAQTYRRD